MNIVFPFCSSSILAWVIGIILIPMTHLVFANDLSELDPLVLSAAINNKADKSVLISVTRVDDKLIAVGEGGTAIFSEDDGKSWTQGKVPVSVTLTGVEFVNKNIGWAVGHSGVILKTNDGGLNWYKQSDGFTLSKSIAQVVNTINQEKDDPEAMPLLAPEPGDPLFDVYFLNEREGFAVGAFGLLLRTSDGGQSWSPWMQHIQNPKDNHYYAIKRFDQHIYIVGERGTILMSDDEGESFSKRSSPYTGSYFGIDGISQDRLVVYGLRGNGYFTEDGGQTWTKLPDSNNNASLVTSTVLGDGTVILANKSGELIANKNNKQSFSLLYETDFPVIDVVSAANNDLILVGYRGVYTISQH